jgi:hypothetical protein
LQNQGRDPRRLAPWEVTRIHASGVTFFPKGREVRGGGDGVGIQDRSGITWFRYDPLRLVKSQKFFADGSEGWLAHADERAILVKSFTDVPPELQAPGEGEIEIYASADADPRYRYTEIEVQGAYESLAPQATARWSITWHAGRLPPDVPVEVGSTKLVNYVKNLLRERESAGKPLVSR